MIRNCLEPKLFLFIFFLHFIDLNTVCAQIRINSAVVITAEFYHRKILFTLQRKPVVLFLYKEKRQRKDKADQQGRCHSAAARKHRLLEKE